MSDNFVERVTRAAYERYLEGLIGCCEPPWDMLPQSHRDNLMGAQRAAIAAMREPTEGMVQSGFERIWNCEVYCREDPMHTVEMQTTTAKTSWQAMIDAALQEDKP